MNSRNSKELKHAIKQWNDSRLDLFSISQPNKNLEFFGVIRFYHHDSSSDGKYATKCVRVSSTAATVDVIDTLSEKFRADMRMLSKPNYALYEVHENGESRKLKEDENPLLVQLNWIKDDREGRFLLKNEDDERPVQVGNGLYDKSEDTVKGFKLTRNLTKKEKKALKKKEKERQLQKNKEEISVERPSEVSAAQQLYTEVPESTFTRTVSNPEAVMKKRREQKLQKRGAEVLKIYGDSINKEIPYKTLYLLPNDKTETVIRDILDKYGLGRESSSDYMIVQVVLPPGSKPEECFEGGWGKETILNVDDCPLDIEQKWQPHQGTLVFQLRHRSGTNHHIHKKKKPTPSAESPRQKRDEQDQPRRKTSDSAASAKSTAKKAEHEQRPRSARNPKFIEFLDGERYESHKIVPNVTEVGGDRRNASYGTFIELRPSHGLMPSHCVITNMDGVVTVTPHDGVGEVFMDGQRIVETTMLSHGDIVWLGRRKHVVFCDPGRDISVPEIKRKIRNSAPREQHPNRNSSTPNLPAGARPREDNVKNMSRNRHYSSTSSVSTNKSASLPPNTQPPDRNQIRNLNNQQQRVLQQRPPPSASVQPSQHRSGLPRQVSQPVQVKRKLPASLSVHEEMIESLLANVLSVKAGSLHFKLSPAYSIYLILRNYNPDQQHNIISTLTLVTDLLEQTIQMNSSSVNELSFWMANTSELLNFFRQDRDLCMVTMETQESFAKTVQLAFRHLVQCMQRTLFSLMPAFLSESDEDLPGGGGTVDLKRQNQNTEDATMYEVLHMLSSAMSLLRKCRVNAALTIQLFSQLFHSINMWLFNKLVASPEATTLCCRQWGIRIRARLAMVETWAEKQGLELAADCHLARITQATQLLQAPKQSEEDIATISGTSFKLNSLQLNALLSNYRPQFRSGEKRISQELIDKVVAVAENSADELTRSDGRDIRLQEDPDLQLPFLLPEDGYSCDVVRGVPSGLTEFIDPFVQEGLCFYLIEPDTTNDSWTVFFHSFSPQFQPVTPASQPSTPSDIVPANKPEIITVTINKRGGGMGLSIVAARGSGQDRSGIYIRSLVKDGASELDGRLQAGDQLLSVDGQSLVGVDQAQAADLMTRTGTTVTLQVAKQGAIYHGLATLLSQPSPKQQHINVAQRRMNPQLAQSRPKSEGYALHPQMRDGSWAPPAKFPHQKSPYDQHSRPILPRGKQTSAFNQSTPQLNEDFEPVRRIPQHTPRSAISMGNLQQSSFESEQGLQPSWKKDRFEQTYKPQPRNTAYTNQRQKAASALNLQTVPQAEPLYNGRPERQPDIIENRPLSGRRKIPSDADALPSPPPQNSTLDKHYQSSLDNPNYDHFPPPPPELEPKKEEQQLPYKSPSPKVVESPRSLSDLYRTASPAGSYDSLPRSKPTSASSLLRKDEKSSKSQTLGRPSSGRKTDALKLNPAQKKSQTTKAANKSSTLPRHFKSTSPWDRDEREKREQVIQEELNALRDEEINELSSRSDLSPLEKDRLKNLLQEREFQNRVQEERMKMFSDEDISEEDYGVPDRPDRDRLIRLEDAQRDAAALKEKEDRNHALWEEEQRRKKEEAALRSQQEAERREARRREREKRERERQEEKKRKEEEQMKEEQERLMREKQKEEFFRSNNDIEERLQREEMEQRQRLEELRRMREEEENQLRELQVKREAEERSFRHQTELRRRQDRISKQKEAEAREEAEREYLENMLSAGKKNVSSAPYRKTSSTSGFNPKSPSYTQNFVSKPQSFDSSRPVMREHSGRQAMTRPVSDGYMLGRTDWDSDHEHSPPPPTTPPASSGGRRPISYVATGSTPGVIGSQEIYKDPRNRREADIKRDQSFKRRGPDPSKMTFKDRQKLFQGSKSSPVSKPKTSRKLLEIEESLRSQM
ncbi:unnamed protein product [Clavelina lepadiformis]|uniref:Afadin n=1 Tax=Clavelina lepadiformis TaxID=159417 RepID=A0ABP0G7X0_CLALP